MAARQNTRIVLTREQERNRPWAERLRAAGIPVLELPLIRHELLPGPFDLDPAAFDWVLFTSPQGVRAFVAAGLADAGGPAARMAALGEGTSATMAQLGLRDELQLATRDGEEFVKRFLDQVPDPRRVLLPGPARRLPEPSRTLTARGVDARELALYRTLPVPPSELPAAALSDDDVVFFCSPSAVRAFTAAYEARPRCVAIGETSATAAREAGFAPAVAATPDLEAMVRAAGLDPLPSLTVTEDER